VNALTRAQELIATYTAFVRAELPPGAVLFDAHTHLGHDIDGMVGDYDQLESLMGQYGVTHAFMFCLDEPDRHPAFRAANDRTLAYVGRPEAASPATGSYKVHQAEERDLVLNAFAR